MPAPSGAMHPLVARLLTEFGFAHLTTVEEVAAFTDRAGAHCLFIPGNAARNLETADAAVILPELRMTFQGAFDCALVDDAIEAQVREVTRALKTPSFVFFRAGAYLGAIEKIRDWDDYLTRITHLLKS